MGAVLTKGEDGYASSTSSSSSSVIEVQCSEPETDSTLIACPADISCSLKRKRMPTHQANNLGKESWPTSMARLLSESATMVYSRSKLISAAKGLPSKITVIDAEVRRHPEVRTSYHSAPTSYSTAMSMASAQTSSVPVKCPSRSSRTELQPMICESDVSARYMTKIYDSRTWDMYNLILEARKRQKMVEPTTPLAISELYQNERDNSTIGNMQKAIDHIDGMHQDSLTTLTGENPQVRLEFDHAMVFSFDDHQ